MDKFTSSAIKKNFLTATLSLAVRYMKMNISTMKVLSLIYTDDAISTPAINELAWSNAVLC